jgi:vacuolar protein sorting-associated protein 53
MSRIREKATESEAVVRTITRDIQALDRAKSSIVTSMTTLKRLQMLGASNISFFDLLMEKFCHLANGLSQLEDLVRAKKYTEISQTLSVSSYPCHVLRNPCRCFVYRYRL